MAHDKETIKELMALVNRTWQISDIEYFPSISLGIAKLPQDADTVKEIHKVLDLAMNNAKKSGKGTYRFFNNLFKIQAEKLINLEGKINRALKNDEFTLNFQPIVRFENKSIFGLEVLVRWNQEIGNMTTGEFIGLAEKTGQIVKIDKWVIENTFRFMRDSMEKCENIVSINMSAKTLSSLYILDYLVELTQKYGVSASCIEFEITEHSLIHDIEKTKKLIVQLKKLGFKIALDDFGTKYSSLNYLKEIPFDTLKIDKSYVDAIDSDKASRIIVGKIIQMAKSLGLDIVGEGIETEDQFETMKALGCDYCQGYIIAKPMGKVAIVKFIEDMNHKIQ